MKPPLNPLSHEQRAAIVAHNQRLARDARLAEIERALKGAAETAAEALFGLGLTPDEVGEFITGAAAESDWMDYASDEND